MGPRTGLDGYRKSRPHRYSIPDSPIYILVSAYFHRTKSSSTTNADFSLKTRERWITSKWILACWLGFNSRHGADISLFATTQEGLSPTQPSVKWLQRVVSSGLIRTRRKPITTLHLVQKIKNMWSCTFRRTHVFITWCSGTATIWATSLNYPLIIKEHVPFYIKSVTWLEGTEHYALHIVSLYVAFIHIFK